MNKQELVDAVAEKTGVSKKNAGNTLDAVWDVITETLAKGERVGVIGFGTFEVRNRAARVGRNPQNGDEIQIPAIRVAAFAPGKALKQAVAS